MTPDNNNKRINLLPGDLERRREIIKRAVAESAPEYTEPSSAKATEGKPAGNGNLLRQKSAPKEGFFKRLFKKKPKTAPRASKDLPAGAPVPSALFKGALPVQRERSQAPAKPPREKKPGFFKRLFSKKTVPVQGTDFLKAKSVPKSVVPPAPASPQPAPKILQGKALPFFQRFFSKKSAPIQTTSAPLRPEPVLKKEEPPAKPKSPAPPSAPKPVPVVPLQPEPKPAPLPEPKTTSQPEPAKKEASEPAADKPFDVNLLSAEYRAAFVPARGKAVFGWSLGGTLLLILLAYASVYLYRARNERAIGVAVASAAEIEQAVATFSGLAEEDQELAKKANALEKLFESHLSFNSFLRALEGATIPEVMYTSIAVSREGSVSIAAQAPSYTALARQLTVYEEDTPWLLQASMSSASLIRDELGAEAGVGFDVTLTVDPAIFKPEL